LIGTREVAMADIEHIVCDDVAEAEVVQRVIHKGSGMAGLDVPYVTPLRPEDRHGPDDGSTVTVQRIALPHRLNDGTIAIPYTASSAPILVGAAAAPGQMAEAYGCTVAQFARLKVLHNQRRVVPVTEYAADQSGMPSIPKKG